MNFDEVAIVAAGTQLWVHSPADGIARVKLEREAEESGHVTSFVRFDAGASFPLHDHPQGEEIYVMQGTFSDENGDTRQAPICGTLRVADTHHFPAKGVRYLSSLTSSRTEIGQQLNCDQASSSGALVSAALKSCRCMNTRENTLPWSIGQPMKSSSHIGIGAVRRLLCLKGPSVTSMENTRPAPGYVIRTSVSTPLMLKMKPL